MRVEKYGNYWAVYDASDNLVCITVYKKGAKEVAARLAEVQPVCADREKAHQHDYIRLTKEVRSLNKSFIQFLRAIEITDNLLRQTN